MGHEIHSQSYTGLPPAEMSAWHEPEPDYLDGANFCIGIAVAITPALIALGAAIWLLS